VPHVLRGVGSLADVRALLAALVAADVDAVHLHTGHGLEDDPRVPRRRDLLELLLVDDGAGLDLARVEERLRAGDRHRRLDARELQLGARLGVLADGDLHVRLRDLREALQLVRYRVLRRAQVQEAVLAARVRRLGLRRAGAGEGHGDAGQ